MLISDEAGDELRAVLIPRRSDPLHDPINRRFRRLLRDLEDDEGLQGPIAVHGC